MTSTRNETGTDPQLRPWGPNSLSWRAGIDWRAVLTSRVAILMQVAHPVVGAGVMDHSEFLEDRWARITATAASARRFSGLDGPDAAIDEGRRLREMHAEIKGVDAQGRKYHALNADAYLWVAATGYWSSATIRRVHNAELDDAQEDALYEEWKDQARVLRIPERVIPVTRADFWDYVEHTVSDVLERNSCTDLLIELDRHPLPRHPKFSLPTPFWNVMAIPLAALLRLATSGYVPEPLRDRLGIEWDSGRARQFSTLVSITNGLDKVLPDRARHPLLARTN
jgi:uncharacterized protein (DUF2236 family)